MEEYINTLYTQIVCEKLQTPISISVSDAIVYHYNNEFKIQNKTDPLQYIILPQLQVTRAASCIVFPLLEWENTDMTNTDLYTENTLMSLQYYLYNILIKISRNTITYYIRKNYNKNYYLYKILLEHANKQLQEETFELAITSIFTKPPQLFGVSNFKFGNIELFNYQKQDILWMQAIEKNEYTIKIPYTLNNTEYLYDLKYNGGNIVSEMGLGKSIIVLSFLFMQSNPYDKYILNYNKNCNYFYKKGSKMHTNCNKKIKNPESIFCNEHSKRILYDKLSFEVDYHRLKSIGYYHSNASLILCPEHIGHQWYTEYNTKFFGKRVVMILTSQQYNNLLLSDILLADIIIISYKMISVYNHNHNHNTSPLVNFKSRLTSTSLTLFDFTFKRVFLDEIHQLNNDNYTSILPLIQKCQYCWNISGTPFIKGYTGMIEILKLNTNINELPDCGKITIDKCVENTFNLFRKNTQESIKYNDQCNYLNNNILHELQLLTFTHNERVIYDGKIVSGKSKYDEELIKLCCDPELYNKTKNLIRHCKSLQEIKDILKDELKDDIINIKLKIVGITKNMENNTENELRGLRISLAVNNKNLINKQKNLDYLNKTIDDSPEQCVICLDDMQDISITKCGHKYCTLCITNLIKTLGNESGIKCPQCCSQLTYNQILNIESNVNTGMTDLEIMVHENKSTKIGNLIYYIQNEIHVNDKIIIFSQWDELLHKVGNKISRYFDILYCSGSLHQKNKAIKSFNNNPDTNIIMLSSKNSASGINLSCANKIIFIEPILGNKKYRDETENQAISRAHRIGNTHTSIKIIKFIIKDTIELDIYNNNVDDLQIRQY
jgi:SNF2 family DNA or RNA helicase